MIAALQASIDAALAARERLRGRSVRETAHAVAEAAQRWARDPALAAALPAAAGLSPAMLATVLPIVADAIDADTLVELHDREAGPQPPDLVAHVLASNVPALAVPAIAHALLAGSAVLVKSGRADTHSATAFHRALTAVDPALAAMVVTTYWKGGAGDGEDTILDRARVIVATGGDAATQAIIRRYGSRVIAFGDRHSLAVLHPDVTDRVLDALATDVVLYEQRGCLSPHAVVVVGDDLLPVAERIMAALERHGHALPPPPLALQDRAAHRLAVETAVFAGGRVLDGAAGTVILDPSPRIGEAIGRRTVRLHAARSFADVTTTFPTHAIECVGVGPGVRLDAEALRRHGVSRLCPIGRMQRPRVDWPRGQRPALGTLFRAAGEPRIQVES